MNLPILSTSTTRHQSNSFLVPEGNYRGILDRYKEKNDGKEIRVLFKIPVQESLGGFYMAAKNYPASLEPGGKLRLLLETLRGHDLTEPEIASPTFNLDIFLGVSADLVIKHIHNARYPYPFANIESIYKAGTLIKEADLPCLSHTTKTISQLKGPKIVFGTGNTQTCSSITSNHSPNIFSQGR